MPWIFFALDMQHSFFLGKRLPFLSVLGRDVPFPNFPSCFRSLILVLSLLFWLLMQLALPRTCILNSYTVFKLHILDVSRVRLKENEVVGREKKWKKWAWGWCFGRWNMSWMVWRRKTQQTSSQFGFSRSGHVSSLWPHELRRQILSITNSQFTETHHIVLIVSSTKLMYICTYVWYKSLFMSLSHINDIYDM